MIPLLKAIATVEGFYEANSRSVRNNNPGDLIWGDEAAHFGAEKGDPEFAVFPNEEAGWYALQRWLSVPATFVDELLIGGYCGATLTDVIYRFAPPSENSSSQYLDNVCELTGLTPDTIVTPEL